MSLQMQLTEYESAQRNVNIGEDNNPRESRVLKLAHGAPYLCS